MKKLIKEYFKNKVDQIRNNKFEFFVFVIVVVSTINMSLLI